jgi:peroxin-19
MATQQELDDLDDLDGTLLSFYRLTIDILDDFDSSTAPPSSTASDLPQPSKNTSTHGPPKPPPPSTSSATLDPPSFTEEDFAKQLQQGMEQLMRDMESPSTRNEFESLVKSMSDATAAPKPSGTATTSFSETISRTMERMQESETAADQASTETPNETDAFLAEMLRQLDSAGGGDGVGGEEGMAKLLEGMMEQLMSKEILYEPMKDLQEKVIIRFLCGRELIW